MTLKNILLLILLSFFVSATTSWGFHYLVKAPQENLISDSLSIANSKAHNSKQDLPIGENVSSYVTPVDSPSTLASLSQADINNEEPLHQEIKPVSDKFLSEKELQEEVIFRQQPAYRQKLLVESGFTTYEAQAIMDAEFEADRIKMQNRYERLKLQAKENQDSDNSHLPANNDLRINLGDDGYERYLESKGQPTAISISGILPDSAADYSGLKPGDKIRGYAGDRVFSASELLNLTVDGKQGETVIMEVERDNDIIQLAIPRGPIGIRPINFRRN